MNTQFDTFFELSKEEYKQLWKECIFVFDANVLLNLYRYTESTRNQFLKTIKEVEDRIWIPFQVGLEFQKNRLTVIQDQLDSYGKITNTIQKKSAAMLSELDEELKDYKKRHPSLDLSNIKERINSTFQDLISDINKAEEDHPNLMQNDVIWHKINNLFQGKVGEPFDQEDLDEIYKHGEKRYSYKIPPGYEDLKEKKGKIKYFNGLYIKEEFGDLILWKEILKKAKTENKQIIFVTDDEKEDWWEIVKRRVTIGPRFELINEFKSEVGTTFYMYKTHRFLDYAKEYLQSEVDINAIKEIKNFRESQWDKYLSELDSTEKDELIKELKYNDELSEYLNEYINENFTHEEQFDMLSNTSKRILKKRNKSHYNHEYKVGDFVKHKNWETGEVLATAINPNNGLQEITVEFDTVGTKRLLAKYAPIEKLNYK
ncbi:PIN domain-containing protein [Aquibacillus koreensis]|uniref:PIN domain-containing protein n=1 Tax=Aquibacillus koreensis TaxID=279446 RepID=A0A9X3WJZ7_9BACI|nr:PIN-like domain-containing protein [Aquibacillus koreensis]MCT2535700.1 PIN domain-containing protein [Aquibacillus koreensis]MDC3420015.1 PIN domain-containing protein [Aquibacillus koreensis]